MKVKETERYCFFLLLLFFLFDFFPSFFLYHVCNFFSNPLTHSSVNNITLIGETFAGETFANPKTREFFLDKLSRMEKLKRFCEINFLNKKGKKDIF